MEWNEVVHGEISFILFHHLLLFLFPPIWGAQGIIQFLKLLNIKVSLSRSHKLLNIYFFSLTQPLIKMIVYNLCSIVAGAKQNLSRITSNVIG